jgi:hypothetical protein
MLTDEHKQECMGAVMWFWNATTEDGFLDHITGNEIWILHYTPESKWQYQEWYHAHSVT